MKPSKLFVALSLLSALHLSAADGPNLLSYNPSFEDARPAYLQRGVRDQALGWITEHTGYSGNAITKLVEAPEGVIVFTLSGGGRVETSPEGRASVEAGKNYELRFQARKTKEADPTGNHGIVPSIDFYDANEKLIARLAGKKMQTRDVCEWAALSFQATAPAEATKAGVKIVLDRGMYPKSDTATFQLDDFKLLEMSAK